LSTAHSLLGTWRIFEKGIKRWLIERDQKHPPPKKKSPLDPKE